MASPALPCSAAALLWTAVLGLLPPGSATAQQAAPTATPPAKLIMVSWDGAADWVVDRLLAEGQMPNLAALAARGVAADYSLTAYPSKTAVGHAAAFTGCWPACNGIVDNYVPLAPLAEHTPLEKRSGFASASLMAEPLYVTAARAGKKVVVLSATQSHPAEPHVAALQAAGIPAENFLAFSGFEYPLAPGHMVEAGQLEPAGREWGRLRRRGALQGQLEVAEETFYLLAYDDPEDPTSGLDTVLVRQHSPDARQATASAVLKPRPPSDSLTDGGPPGWSQPLWVHSGEQQGATFFRLFELAPDGSRLALYQSAVSGRGGSAPDAEAAAYLEAYPGFHDDPFPAYEAGIFGLPLMAGGDGTAEQRVLELVAHDTQMLIEGTRFALERWHPDALFHYSPMADSAGHIWVGLLDPQSPCHQPELAAKVWPYYARVFQLLDEWLGATVKAAPPETIYALFSDHGMEGIGRHVYVNRVLEDAGLLVRNPGGDIDLSRTRALVPAYGYYFVVVNEQGRFRSGIVPPAERDAVLAAATDALLDARDPETGHHVIPRVFRADQFPGLGIGGPRGGDLYYDLAPGYYPQSSFPPQTVAATSQPWGHGVHGFFPQRRTMHAIFYAAGPGLKQGVKLPGIRHIDIAPTLAWLLGIPAPAQAQGQVLGSALELPPR